MHRLFILLALLFASTLSAKSPYRVDFRDQVPQEASAATKKAYEQYLDADYELGHFGTSITECILHCSYVQDVLYSYLHNAETEDEYLRGMQLFYKNTRSLKSVCTYITSVFNFYTATSEFPKYQEVEIAYNGQEISGFLNTFKQKNDLSSEERSRYFEEEYAHFSKDAVTYPFTLDATALLEIRAETVYNFVLLPDGTVRAALERPGDREYQVAGEAFVEAFRYPNHTILAGAADQAVVTAGAFVLHKVGNKKLFIVSSKSGHFQPTYSSLEHMREHLATLGIHLATVLALPDINMASSLIKTYKGATVPLLLTQADASELFLLAKARWEACYRQLDRSLLEQLASGDLSCLDASVQALLKAQRAESTYMRSCYNLFSQEHKPSLHFGEFVKRFGKLKDAVKRFGTAKFNPKRVKDEATTLLQLIDQEEEPFIPADDASLAAFINGNFAKIHALLAANSLDREEYHDLKKLSRETGTLFMYMAEAAKCNARGHFVFRSAADGFFQVNDLLAQIDYILDEQDAERVKVPRKVANQLIKYISRIGAAPSTFTFILDPNETRWMVNSAKELYITSSILEDTLRFMDDDIDLTLLARVLKLAVREIECARNTLIFLDITHKAPDEYETFLKATHDLIAHVEKQDLDAIKSVARDYMDLCYHVPSKGLQKWVMTDQESFSQLLKSSITPLYDLQEGAWLSLDRAKEIALKAQALYDFANLNRHNGIFRRVEPGALPMICFDRLETASYTLWKLLDEASDTSQVTPQMAELSSFITSRIE